MFLVYTSKKIFALLLNKFAQTFWLLYSKNKTCHRFTNNGKEKKNQLYVREVTPLHVSLLDVPTGNISCVVVEGWGGI